MTPGSISACETDRAALQRLRDALGAEALSMLADSCAQDLDEACAGLAAPSLDGETVKKLAHKMAGLLGQYACPSASAFARGLAQGAAGDALAAAGLLAERGRACAAELRALATAP
jgi:hypothetical protein